MTSRLEIRLKDGLPDASGVGIQKKSKAYFGFNVDDVQKITDELIKKVDETTAQKEQEIIEF